MNDPHSWMFRTEPEELAMKVETKDESIRAWYERKTKGARKILFWATILSIIGAGLFFRFASFKVAAFCQTANGAVTIPIAGAIWIAAFVYIFLLPSREVGFRSQESFEQMLALVKTAVHGYIAPTVAVWRRIGERIERDFPRALEESRETIQDIRSAAKHLEEAVKKNERFSEDAKPVIESLRRIETRIEAEIQTGLIEDIRQAAESVKGLSGMPKDPTVPDAGLALAALRRSRAKAMEGRP